MGTLIVNRARPNEITPVSWQAPPFEASPEERMGWLEEQIQEGNAWLEGQTAYKDLWKNLKIFNAIFSDKTKSTLVSNKLKYNVRKFIETISDVREIGTYGSDAKQFKPYVEMLNKVVRGVYMESAFPRAMRKVLQFSTVMGRGYLWPKCKARNYGFGERQIVFQVLGPLDVVPVQIPPSTNDIQDAYAVTIYEYMPIAEAHGRFPLFQSQLKPISGCSYESRVAARRVDTTELLHYGDNPIRNFGDLYCEIRYTFIRDIRINNTGKELPMGDPGTSWFYKVPYIGQDVFGGIKDNQPTIRKAVLEDCRVYPFLRLMISSSGMTTPMYDGPQFDCHGEIPPVQYDVDDWAWEGMGRSLVGDVGSIETTKRKLERKMDQVITTSLNPPLGYDRSAGGGPTMENFDIFEQDVRIGLDAEPTKAFQSVLPESVKVVGEHFKFWEMLDEMEQEQLGIKDIGNLENLKMSLSSDNVDKVLEPIGPIAKGIAAGMEAANAKVAYQLKFMIPQWYDTRRIIEYIGPDNITPEVFDLDPKNLVPSHMSDEYVNGNLPVTDTGIPIQSHYQPVDRMRRFGKSLRLISVPTTLLRMTQQQEQLKLMTLKKQGAPIGWVDILPKLGIENYGEVKGNTVRERYINEQLEDLKLKILAAKLAAESGLGGEGGEGQGKGGGRPNSNKRPPKQYQKGGGGGEPRTGVKTS